MGHLLDALRSIVTAAKSFVRPPTTVQFPKEVRPRAERYRASFALLHEENGDEACIGCLQCERICPSKIISVKGPAKRDSPITGKKRSYADDFTLDLSACIFCELCVQVCPTDAIVMTKEQEPPAYSREDLVLTMPKLYANEKSKTRAWGDGTKLNEMQAIPKPAPAAPAPAPTASLSPAGERVGERGIPAASPSPAPTTAVATIPPGPLATIPPAELATIPPAELATRPPGPLATIPPAELATIPPAELATVPPAELATVAPGLAAPAPSHQAAPAAPEPPDPTTPASSPDDARGAAAAAAPPTPLTPTLSPPGERETVGAKS